MADSLIDVRGAGVFRKFTTPLHALSLYAAAGIACFGWTLSRLLQFRCDHYLPLWFFGTLLIYNLDRLKTDPADRLNTPQRTHAVLRFRKISMALVVVSAIAVLTVPALEGDRFLLGLTPLAALLSINYSVPLLGFRWKDIPLLKTIFVPTLVTSALLLPAFLQQKHHVSTACFLIVSAWTWLILLCNVFLCDQRDLRGDNATGVRTLAVLLGPAHTFRALWVLLGAVAALSWGILWQRETGTIVAWKWIVVLVLIYLGILLLLSRKPMPEHFYEWWVEGLLFVPFAAYLIPSWSRL